MVESPNEGSLCIIDQLEAMCFGEIHVLPAILFPPKINVATQTRLLPPKET